MFTEPAPVAAALLVTSGIVAVGFRLRRDFDGPVTALAIALLVGATPLSTHVWHGSVLEAAVFTMSALPVWALHPAMNRSRVARLALWSALLLVPLAAIQIEGRFPRGLDALFSSGAGLLSLTPVMYLACIGAVAQAGYLRDPGAAAPLVALALWAIAGAPLSGAMAALAPGLAHLIAWARRRPLVAAAPVVIAACVWNHWLMVQYTVGLLPKDAPVEFARMVRQQADVHTMPPYVYPFAFPANALFAWREGVPLDRYDVLSGIPPQPAFDLVLDRDADRFLLDGWDAPGPDAVGPVRWIASRRAELVFPFDPPAGDVAITITARARLDEPAVNVEMNVEINGKGIGGFTATADAPVTALLSIPASDVGRVFRAGYNRLSIVNLATHPADPGDRRAPGPLASRLGSRPWPVAIHRIHIAPSR